MTYVPVCVCVCVYLFIRIYVSVFVFVRVLVSIFIMRTHVPVCVYVSVNMGVCLSKDIRVIRGAGRSSEVERSLMVQWVVGSILHGVDPLSYF